MKSSHPGSRSLSGMIPVLVALLLIGPGRAAAPPSEEAPGPAAVAEALQATFADSEASNLEPYLSRRIKTYLALSDVGPASGYYGADQALLLMRRMFKDRTTIRFTLTPPPGRPGTIVLQGRWTFKDDTTSRSELHFVFIIVPDGSAWRIREIRAHK